MRNKIRVSNVEENVRSKQQQGQAGVKVGFWPDSVVHTNHFWGNAGQEQTKSGHAKILTHHRLPIMIMNTNTF